ncbi:O-antigen ligase family protein [Marinobacterium jannaschii]|uniref:O-antigen ligase family protein n=1 Tax=Marinobacterium jannaschii TaxID=64970 RepID=UPI0004803AA0|nr:O-antigen ligase family protein [Marinobacterium jannaschii]
MSVVVESQSLRIERVGNWALYLFFLTAWVAPGAANLALLTMLVCSLLTPRVSLSAWSRMPIFWLVVAWNLYLGLRLGLVYIETPEQFGIHLSATADFFKLSLFFIVGWWARGDERKIKLLLVLALTGLVLNTLKRVDWDSLPHYLFTNRRTGFGVQIPMAALLSGALVVGLVALHKEMVGSIGRWRLGRGVMWTLLLTFSLTIVFHTQTRAIWLALIILTPSILFCQYGGAGLKESILRGVALLLISVLVLVGLYQLDTVSSRVLYELETIKSIFDPQRAVPGGSLGVRYHAVLLGFEAWWEKAWLGWGAGYELAKEGADSLPLKIYHLHNTYLELLVRFGAIGIGILSVGAALLLFTLLDAWRKGVLEHGVVLALIGLGLNFAIWSLADYQIMRGYCQMYWFLLGGLFLSVHFSQSFSIPPVSKEELQYDTI